MVIATLPNLCVVSVVRCATVRESVRGVHSDRDGTERRVTETRTFVQENNINLVAPCRPFLWEAFFSFFYRMGETVVVLLSTSRKPKENMATSLRCQ